MLGTYIFCPSFTSYAKLILDKSAFKVAPPASSTTSAILEFLSISIIPSFSTSPVICTIIFSSSSFNNSSLFISSCLSSSIISNSL